MGLEVWLVPNRKGIPVALHGGAADAAARPADLVGRRFSSPAPDRRSRHWLTR
jgi:hypothetical protein